MAERKIAGMEVRVDKPLATVALVLQARLTKAAGGALAKLPEAIAELRAASLSDNKEDAAQQAGATILSGLTEIFSRLEPQEYADLVGDIISLAKRRGPSGQYDQMDLDGDFSSNLGAIIPVCVFVLKEVFGDFFSAALGNMSRPAKASH